jgi:virginiamycin B lyase
MSIGGARTPVVFVVAALVAASCSEDRAPAPSGSPVRPSPQVTAPAGVPAEATLVPLQGRLQAEFAIDGEPDWLAEGFGSIWVSRTDPEGGGNMLDRIDPATNEVVASIELGRNPCHGVAVEFGSVWVPTCIDQRIDRVDPDTNSVIESIEIPLHREDGSRMAADFGALWIVSPNPKGGDVLARIDPSTGGVDRIPLPTPSTEVVTGFGSVWVVSPDGGVVHRVDPDGQRIEGAIEGLAEPETAAVGEDSLLVKDAGDGTIAVVDPTSLEITGRIEIGSPGVGGGIAAEGRDVWFRPANYLLGRVDVAAGAVAEAFPEPPALGDVIVEYDSVWFSGYTKNTVWRISI